MGVRAAGLTAIKVKTAPPGRYGDGDGLYLFVRSPESAFWVFRYTRAGKMREMGLGRARGRNAVPLVDARDKGGELHKLVRAGRDPLADRDAAADAAKVQAAEVVRRAITFREVAEEYLAANGAGWRNPKHRAQWGSTLTTYAYPTLGSLPVADVTTQHVLDALKPIWTVKPETAARVRGRIETVLTAATVKGLRTGQNPAAWKGHLAELLPARGKVAPVVHHAALPWKDMPTFFLRLQAADGLGARALEFAILTAARTGEVLGATWAEFDLDAAVWTVAADRMKGHREHRVALSTVAVQLLRKLATIRRGEFVFTGQVATKPLSNMALLMTLRRMKRADLTAHGMRSTFRDWVAEATDYQGELAEAALAHVVGDKTEAAYRRGDLFEKRRAMMEAWAGFCVTTC
jgi:integrase